ncbi:HAMP domain-containing protein [Cellulomonas soli]
MSLAPTAAPRSRRLADLPVGARIGSALAIAVLVVLSVTVIGLTRLSSLESSIERLNATAIEPQSYLVATQRWFQASRARVLEYGMVPEADQATIVEERAGYDADALKNIEGYGPFVLDDASYAALQDAYARYQQASDAIMPLAADGAVAYHDAYVEQIRPITSEIGDALQALTDSVAAQAALDVKASATQARSATALVVGVGVVGVLLAIGLVVVVVRRLVRDLGRVQHTVENMGRGDLTLSVDLDSHDELGRMAASLNVAQQNLRDLMAGVVSTAGSVAAAAEELSSASSQVSASSEETSAQAGVVAAAAEQVSRNVQAVAAGAEEMGASIREIAQNATEAAKVAGAATGWRRPPTSRWPAWVPRARRSATW